MRNPDWTRDELILALELYMKQPAARRSKNHPAVAELSELLNSLPFHGNFDRQEKFRNPDGVRMKLGNFLRFDPNYKGRGLARGNTLEQEIWEEFAQDVPRLQKIATALDNGRRSRLNSGERIA